MIDRYSHWIDVNLSDDCSGLYKTRKGLYVLFEDHKERENFLVAALQSLHNSKHCSREMLNEFVERVLQGYV